MIIPGITSTDLIDDAILRGLVERRIEVEGPDFDYADEALVGYARSVRAALERAGLLMPAGAEVREEFGTRITFAFGTVDDRWCYRDRDEAAASAKHYADLIPYAAPDGRWHGATASLIRRLHLTLPAETVEEQPAAEWVIRKVATGEYGEVTTDEAGIRRSWAQGITWYDPDGAYELCRRASSGGESWEVVDRRPVAEAGEEQR